MPHLRVVLLVATGEGDELTLAARHEQWAPMCLAADPADPRRVLCGTYGAGLWCSEDSGSEFARVPLGHDKVTALAFAADGGQPEVWAGTKPSAVYRSRDGGRTWQQRPGLEQLPSRPDWFYPPRPDIHYVRWIVADPDSPEHVLVAIEQGALVSTRDGGETWEDRVPGGPFDIHTMAMPEGAGGRLYAVTRDGFVRAGHGFWESSDGGRTWSCPGAGLAHHYLWSLAVDPGDPTTMVITAANCPTALHSPMTGECFVYRRSGGGSWSRCDRGLPDARGTIEPVVAAHAAEHGTFYALTNKGLYRSADQGSSWRRLDLPWDPSLTVRAPRALAITAA